MVTWATIVSRLFEPIVVLPIVSLLGAKHYGLTGPDFTRFLIFLAAIIMIPLGLFRWWLYHHKDVTWDVPDRRKRIVPLMLLLVFLIVNNVAVGAWQNAGLNRLFLLFLVWTFGFLLITSKWKISGHAGINALATGLVIAWYGWRLWPILAIVPLVSWARVVRRDHTEAQVVGGAFYSWIILSLFWPL